MSPVWCESALSKGVSTLLIAHQLSSPSPAPPYIHLLCIFPGWRPARFGEQHPLAFPCCPPHVPHARALLWMAWALGSKVRPPPMGGGHLQEAELDEEISPTAARAAPGSQPWMTREGGEIGHCQAGGCPQGQRPHRAIRVAPPPPPPAQFPGPLPMHPHDHWFCLLFPVPRWSWEHLASAPCRVEQDSSQPAAWALTRSCAFLSPPAGTTFCREGSPRSGVRR